MYILYSNMLSNNDQRKSVCNSMHVRLDKDTRDLYATFSFCSHTTSTYTVTYDSCTLSLYLYGFSSRRLLNSRGKKYRISAGLFLCLFFFPSYGIFARNFQLRAQSGSTRFNPPGPHPLFFPSLSLSLSSVTLQRGISSIENRKRIQSEGPNPEWAELSCGFRGPATPFDPLSTRCFSTPSLLVDCTQPS